MQVRPPCRTQAAIAAALSAPPNRRHIRLTSHPGQGAGGAPTLRWGAADPAERGPVVGTTTNRGHRNVVGTHSGSYGIYRALSVAAGNLVRGHRADLTDTAPTDATGPYPAWSDPHAIVSIDPWGARVAEVYAGVPRPRATTSARPSR